MSPGHHHRNPHALLTPAMHKVLEHMARAGHMPLHALTPQQARTQYAAGSGVLETTSPALARVESFTIATRDGYAMPARLYAATDAALPVLLYFHGGGFTLGSIATHEILCKRLASLAGCAVVSVDYRLAPEHKFPTASNDAWDALQWLAASGADLRLAPRRIAVGGDSAGGTLAAVCAILARDAGLPLALQLLFYPGTCGHQSTPSHHKFGSGFLLESTHIDYFFNHYIRTPADRDDWRFAPLDGVNTQGHQPDLVGVAPAWIGLAECDPLVDEGIQFGDQLRMAGVAVDLDIYRGVVHEFIKMGRAIPQALQAHADAARALRAALFD